MTSEKDDLELINKLLEIYDQKYLGEYLNQVSPGQWCRETINRWVKGKASPRLSHREFEALQELFPKPPLNHPNYDFDFVDLFAGIGGIRRGFELAGGRSTFGGPGRSQLGRHREDGSSNDAGAVPGDAVGLAGARQHPASPGGGRACSRQGSTRCALVRLRLRRGCVAQFAAMAAGVVKLAPVTSTPETYQLLPTCWVRPLILA